MMETVTLDGLDKMGFWDKTMVAWEKEYENRDQEVELMDAWRFLWKIEPAGDEAGWLLEQTLRGQNCADWERRNNRIRATEYKTGLGYIRALKNSDKKALLIHLREGQ